MSKLIINNRSDCTDTQALEMVMGVVKQGRISNHDKQYCYITTFTIKPTDGALIKTPDKTYVVATDLNKKSDRFTVSNYLQPKGT